MPHERQRTIWHKYGNCDLPHQPYQCKFREIRQYAALQGGAVEGLDTLVARRHAVTKVEKETYFGGLYQKVVITR